MYSINLHNRKIAGEEIMNRYEEAKKIYAEYGVDTEAALAKLANIPISIHCWQGDDIDGFESNAALTGGIQVTGNYPGKASGPDQLMADLDFALSCMPGKKRINLHAIYAVADEKIERDNIKPEYFDKWIEFAKERGLGIDFNPTFFSHPMVKGGLTLSSPDEEVRNFWIRHGITCNETAHYIAQKLGTPVLYNLWIPDGLKDIPADRLTPRLRLKDSLDKIFATKYDDVIYAVESKVFGIGVESYTVGSNEFYLNYAAKNGICCLLDNGHYHPTEVVSDKIPSMLAFNDYVALHVTRCVRWDSDHVVLYEDELREIAKEIVRNDATDRVLIGLDYFDASINRISAWVVGQQAMSKALLNALLIPSAKMKEMQDSGNFTALMVLSEESKTLPIGDVWNEYLRRCSVDAKWFDKVLAYEKEELAKR